MWELIHNKKYAFEIFGSSDSLDETNETLSVLPSESKSVTINEFNNAKLINLDKVSDGTGEDLELSLDDKIISIGIDQSGSQTWNDPSENRYDLIERFINKSSSTYPGNLYYNLFKFGGKNIRFYTGYANENNNPFNELSVPEDCKIELDPFGDELNRFAGYRIVKNKKRYPRSPLDGEIVFEGIANKLSDTDVSFDQNYYYSIYVFDKNLKFSKGKSLKIFPNNNDIPNGLDIVEVEALKGSGAFVDDSVLGVWHMDEGKGDSLFDFSGKSQFNLNDHIWLAESEVPVGLSGLRFYGNSISVSDAKNNYAIANTSKIGISF